jgi:hypothetical protein
VRVDREVDGDEARFAVLRVVWSEDLAEAEVSRLQELNAETGCRYFSQHTRSIGESVRRTNGWLRERSGMNLL